MPATSVGDVGALAHPSATCDTPGLADAGPSDDFVARFLAAQRQFPSVELVDAAAAMLPGVPPTEKAGRDTVLHEGPQWFLTVSPGRFRVWARDGADLDRRETRELDARSKTVDAMASFLEFDDDGELVHDIPDPVPSRMITDWSSKSRSNMYGKLRDLDYAPLFADPTLSPAMLTFTYPGCWLTVAPDGKAVKKHMKTFRKRFKRRFGRDLACIWKLEFQRRLHDLPSGASAGTKRAPKVCSCEVCDGRDDGRAPHVHMFAVPPRVDADGNPVNFREWARAEWAEIIDHPDPVHAARGRTQGVNVDWAEGLRATDPQRVVTYFAKHNGASGKEYQHVVPAAWREIGKGPGRFWGYWVLKPHTATREARPRVGQLAGRLVHRYSRAQQVTRQVSRPRVRGGRMISKYPDVVGLAGAQMLAARSSTKHRKTRVRAERAKRSRGWVGVNDGAAFGMDMARALHLLLDQERDDANRAALDAAGRADVPLARALRLRPGPVRDRLVGVFRNTLGWRSHRFASSQ